MSSRSKELLVYLDCIPYTPDVARESTPEKANQILVGTLRFDFAHGKEICSFEYDRSWLASSAPSLDPDLQPFAGRQYPSNGKSLFGTFEDSCPDRWGRQLIARKESERAMVEKRAPRALVESDLLLGIDDRTRMGAFRFADPQTGLFLASSESNPVPPLASIRELEEAARLIERDERDGTDLAALNLLLSPGSSLGGARPKANVRDEKGALWIAKFPSRNDLFDMGLAEAFVNDLARTFDIRTPVMRHAEFSHHGTTLLTKRFDRRGDLRVHFTSAMAQLGFNNGADAQSGAEYALLAEFIRYSGEAPESDLRELFRRIVFSVAISNTDDHLRNHGFLLGEVGWRLSPAFDINPNPSGRHLTLGIDGASSELNFDLVRRTAPYYETTDREAAKLIDDVRLLLKDWQNRAKRFGLRAADRDILAPAFETSWK